MPPRGMSHKKWNAVQDALKDVRFEPFSDAEAILEFKIEVLQEALERVRLAQREPVLGISCDMFHPDGFVSEESKREARRRLGFER